MEIFVVMSKGFALAAFVEKEKAEACAALERSSKRPASVCPVTLV